MATYESDLSNEAVGTTDLPAPTLDSATGGARVVDLSWTLNDTNADGTITIRRDGITVATIGDL